MAKFLFHLGRWSYLHKKRVIGVWLILFATVAGLALGFQKGFNDVFEVQDVPSSHATRLLLEKFPDSRNPAKAATVNVVFQAPEGHTLDEPQYMEAMDATMVALQDTVPNFEAGQQFGNPVTLNQGIQEELVKQLTAQGLPEDTAKKDAYNLRVVSDDGRIGVSTFTFDVPVPGDVTNEDRETTLAAADISREAGLTVEIGGPGFGDPIEVEPISEIAGIVVALIILFFTFGSLLAAGLPLITAVLGVGIGALLTVGATALIPLNSITPTLGVMIGLAVGIDYALFIMSRYRDELREGRSRTDAIGLACGTAGSAVIFAGATVIIALVGLRLADIPFLSYMGYFAGASVFTAVLVALTLLPALLGLGGRRIFKRDATAATPTKNQSDGAGKRGNRRGHGRGAGKRGTKGRHGAGERGRKHGVGEKWIRLVYRVPGLMIGVVMLSLALLTIPAMNLQLSLPNDMTANVDSTQRKSAELIKEGFGPGRNAPFLLVVNAEGVDENAAALQPYIRAQEGLQQGSPEGEPEPPAEGGVIEPASLSEEEQPEPPAEGEPAEPAITPEEARKKAEVAASFIYTADQMSNNIDVQHAQLVGQSPDGTTAQILVTPTTGLRDEQTVNLIDALRTQQREIEGATGVDMGITGFMPILQDVTDRLAQSMPIYLALVVGLALVLLLMVFRSLLVPLMAVGGFLLSVGAAFGVTVLVWQEGLWGLWHSPGPLISFMPIFLIGVTFGLAMDYQVFIVSRMRERYIHQSQKETARPGVKYSATEDSVIYGFGLGARVVTAAALIMIGVFASFIFQPLPFIQIFGFALGAGVLFDAFFIRMTMIPALMILFDRATWKMPRWLDKVLPTFDVEGSAVEKAFSAGEIQRMDDQGRPLEGAGAGVRIGAGAGEVRG